MERVLGDFRYMERGLVTYIFVCWCVCFWSWCGVDVGWVRAVENGVFKAFIKFFFL